MFNVVAGFTVRYVFMFLLRTIQHIIKQCWYDSFVPVYLVIGTINNKMLLNISAICMLDDNVVIHQMSDTHTHLEVFIE